MLPQPYAQASAHVLSQRAAFLRRRRALRPAPTASPFRSPARRRVVPDSRTPVPPETSVRPATVLRCGMAGRIVTRLAQ